MFIILGCEERGAGAAGFAIIHTAPLCKPFRHNEGSLGFIPFSPARSCVLPYSPLASNFQSCKQAQSILGAGGFSGMSALPVLHACDSRSPGSVAPNYPSVRRGAVFMGLLESDESLRLQFLPVDE